MDFSEKWGTDVDTAVQLALDDLKLTIDQVNVTVLEEPSRGFFGIGSKLALVRVEKKEELKEKEPKKEEAKPNKNVSKERKNNNVNKNKAGNAGKDEADGTADKEAAAPKAQHSRKSADDKKEDRNASFEKELKEIEPLFETEDNLVDCDDHVALKFIEEITKEMGLDVAVSAKVGKESVYIDINGKDSGTIIGKRGQTLDAIQYLASLVANKGSEDYLRVVVDAENYRRKREKTLMLLANKLAAKVVKTRRSVKLEPMNPYERKVIHATLQSNPKVTTRSEGQEPYRRVIIELK